MLYVTIQKSCDASCLNDSLVGINKEHLSTNPSKIELYHPALCIAKKTNTECITYYMNNIMLGQEIIASACVLDHYDHQYKSTHVTVAGENNSDYHVDGVVDILISCENNKFQGISILGNKTKLFASSNYSMTITYNNNPFSDEETFSVDLVVEIAPCHLGFWHHKESQKCICYDETNVVYCSGSNSTIKRGYWFGIVNGQSTVTVCPINYCDFTCCETTDGFYHLSPLRTNQCRPYRSGSACGSCEESWTLSFDSAECVSIEQCTAGQTVLVVTLTVLYWIAVVTAVFVLMYFKVPVGYLYSITHYYSMLDVMLGQTLNYTQALSTIVNTISSIFKVMPQFLGRLCLVQSMSGIDQQFIHYIHSMAVTFILFIIGLSAKLSYRLSSFISRGIIHVNCFMLLLSYTSVATTSLLLMRILTFSDVNKIYTYLSPDIEYFHGRHLPYAIVAVLCTIVIVIGLPLLLLLEPFLNHKINFTRIKPLLDQFQGCYKDKFCCFAAYNMICRLIIIIFFATTSSRDVLLQFVLVSLCTLMAAVQATLLPYNCQLLKMGGHCC